MGRWLAPSRRAAAAVLSRAHHAPSATNALPARNGGDGARTLMISSASSTHHHRVAASLVAPSPCPACARPRVVGVANATTPAQQSRLLGEARQFSSSAAIRDGSNDRGGKSGPDAEHSPAAISILAKSTTLPTSRGEGKAGRQHASASSATADMPMESLEDILGAAKLDDLPDSPPRRPTSSLGDMSPMSRSELPSSVFAPQSPGRGRGAKSTGPPWQVNKGGGRFAVSKNFGHISDPSVFGEQLETLLRSPLYRPEMISLAFSNCGKVLQTPAPVCRVRPA